jgi:hypothetical protein
MNEGATPEEEVAPEETQEKAPDNVVLEVQDSVMGSGEEDDSE